MLVSYEVQGRRSHSGVRLATEVSRGAALATAAAMAAEGFTAWVFETRPDAAGKKYRLLDTVQPCTP